MLKLFDNKNNENNSELTFYNQPYVFFKPYYKSTIPLDIYQTWSTKELPQKMRERVKLLKNQNP
jgi:mannosyltransferase OCH1-like enzyme